MHCIPITRDRRRQPTPSLMCFRISYLEIPSLIGTQSILQALCREFFGGKDFHCLPIEQGILVLVFG